MKFVADENLDNPIVAQLRQDGHEVYSIYEQEPSIVDEDVLEIAQKSGSVLITQDKDFGTLVFKDKKAHRGIILVRLYGVKPFDKAKIVSESVKKYGEDLIDAFTVIYENFVKTQKTNV